MKTTPEKDRILAWNLDYVALDKKVILILVHELAQNAWVETIVLRNGGQRLRLFRNNVGTLPGKTRKVGLNDVKFAVLGSPRLQFWPFCPSVCHAISDEKQREAGP